MTEPFDDSTSGDTPVTPPTPAAPARAEPAAATPTRSERTPPLPQLIVELREMIVAYLKQQTLVPLADLKRYIAWGVGGSILLGFAVIFLAMAGLRALQTETGDTFTGTWDFAPYAIVFLALVVGGVIAGFVASGRSSK